MVNEDGFRRRKRERIGERERKGKRGLTEGKIEKEIEFVGNVDIFLLVELLLFVQSTWCFFKWEI